MPVGARTFFGKNVTMGKIFKRPLSWKIRSVFCFLFGHRIIVQRWMNAETGKITEYHYGCVRCPMFRTEPATHEG